MPQESKNAQTPSTPQGATPAPSAPISTPSVGLNRAQLTELKRAIIYGAIASGVVMNKPGITPTPKNLSMIQDLAEAVLELLG